MANGPGFYRVTKVIMTIGRTPHSGRPSTDPRDVYLAKNDTSGGAEHALA